MFSQPQHDLAEKIKEWCIIALLVMLIIFVICAVLLIRHADADLLAARQSLSGTTSLLRNLASTNAEEVHATVADARRVILSVGGTAAEIRKTAKVEAKSAQDQANYILETEKKAAETLGTLNAAALAVNQLVIHTDAQINGQLLPTATRDLQQLSSLLEKGTEIAAHTDSVVTNLGPPLQDAAQHGASGAGHLDAIAADGQAIADHYKKVLTSPTTPGKAVLKYIGEWFARFFGSAI